jgi:hypothetical protein
MNEYEEIDRADLRVGDELGNEGAGTPWVDLSPQDRTVREIFRSETNPTRVAVRISGHSDNLGGSIGLLPSYVTGYRKRETETVEVDSTDLRVAIEILGRLNRSFVKAETSVDYSEFSRAYRNFLDAYAEQV